MVGWWDLWGEESTAGTHGNGRVPLNIVALGNALETMLETLRMMLPCERIQFV